MPQFCVPDAAEWVRARDMVLCRQGGGYRVEHWEAFLVVMMLFFFGFFFFCLNLFNSKKKKKTKLTNTLFLLFQCLSSFAHTYTHIHI